MDDSLLADFHRAGLYLPGERLDYVPAVGAVAEPGEWWLHDPACHCLACDDHRGPHGTHPSSTIPPALTPQEGHATCSTSVPSACKSSSRTM